LVHVAQQTTGFGAQHLPGWSQTNAARGPLEKGHAQTFLDPLHLARDGALREAGKFRRLCETAMLRHEVKEMQLVDIEGRCLQKLMHAAHESMALMNFTPNRKTAKLWSNPHLYGLHH